MGGLAAGGRAPGPTGGRHGTRRARDGAGVQVSDFVAGPPRPLAPPTPWGNAGTIDRRNNRRFRTGSASLKHTRPYFLRLHVTFFDIIGNARPVSPCPVSPCFLWSSLFSLPCFFRTSAKTLLPHPPSFLLLPILHDFSLSLCCSTFSLSMSVLGLRSFL
jgi:hypothetical protein